MDNPAQNDLDQLKMPIMLSFPVINIITFEPSRAALIIGDAAKEVGKHFFSMPFKETPNPAYIRQQYEIIEKNNSKDNQGLVIFDQFFMERQRVNPETIPALKSSVLEMENNGINYIIVSKEAFDDEIAYRQKLPRISDENIIELLKQCEQNICEKGVFSKEEQICIAGEARGLPFTQLKNVLIYSAYLKSIGREYMSEIRKEKAHILRDVGLHNLDPIPMDEVGGLERLKEFLQVRKAGWDKNLPVKGILLAGVYGGGKSLVAQAAAGLFGTTLIRLNMADFYSKFLGETDQRFNRALETIEEIAPVVVLIDEIEKSFSNNDTNHEVSRRLLGSFLQWLQNRTEKIFIVATANRVQSLPPELMRAGRFDRAFFIDLPNKAERHRIFEIHLNKAGSDLSQINLDTLVAATEGYTGAEIEQVIIDARYVANARAIILDNHLLIQAIKQVTPVSISRKEDVDLIRRLKNQGFSPANAIENEDVVTKINMSSKLSAVPKGE